MTTIVPGRFTAQTDKPVVLFLIGMRINNLLALSDIAFMSKTMPAMLQELSQKQDSGMLWFRTHVSLPRYISVQQYWESFDKLLAYAHDKEGHHFPMWAEFNRRIMKSRNIGIWHETYLVEPGKFECVYGNMPPFGLAAATSQVPAEGRLAGAKDRFAP
ncbi:MAG: DUF4188 domain-containing protein [Alphaproteobacteria bacterium]|nr:DUF4188 domain-containing protein [Alphaproteobacteria bacterium]